MVGINKITYDSGIDIRNGFKFSESGLRHSVSKRQKESHYEYLTMQHI